MLHPSRAPCQAVAPERADALGWLLLLPLGCLLLGQALLALQGLLPVLSGGLADPDGYMRLARVLELADGGAWFDPRYPRIDPPDGHGQHWTRALDVLLLAGAWLLQPFLGFARALHVSGVLFSPVCFALMILALNWALSPFLERDARLFACLLLLLQPTVVAYSSLGRPDHHSLLLLLFVLLLGTTLRLLLPHPGARTAALGGAVAALALWVSPEALVCVALCLGILGWSWLLGAPGIAHRTRALTVSLTVALAVALVLERGPLDLLAAESDRLSVVHLAGFALIALFWSAVARLEPTADPAGTSLLQASARRAAIAGTGLALTAAALLVLFPELRHGPLGEVDPLYRALRLEQIVEIQPLLRPDWLAAGAYGAVVGHVVQVVGIALPALPFLLLRLRRAGHQERPLWVATAFGLALFLPLAFWQVRWSSYAEILLVVPYAALLGALLTRISGVVAVRWHSLARPPVLVAGLFWPILVGAALPQHEGAPADRTCGIGELAPALERLADGRPRTILTLADYGPEILYRTRHNVLSIPNHRPQPGFAATHRVLAATDPASARRAFAASRADWILLCPGPVERRFFGAGAGTSLYQRLAAGEVPPWLRRLPLGAGLDGRALLFAPAPAPGALGAW